MQRLKALFPNVRIRRNIEDADEVIIDAQSLSCPVCFSIFAETPLVLHCGHSFCQPCFRRLSHMEVSENNPYCYCFQPVCPYCRTEFDPHTRYPKNFVLEKVLEAIYTNDKEDDPNRGKRNDNAFRIKVRIIIVIMLLLLLYSYYLFLVCNDGKRVRWSSKRSSCEQTDSPREGPDYF